MRKLILVGSLALLLCLPEIGLGQEVRAPEAGTATVSAPVTGRIVKCWKGDLWCLRPSVSLSVMKVNLRTGDFSSGAIPAAGYGIEYDDILSLDLMAGFEVAKDDSPNQITAGIVVGIINYIHVGVAMLFREGEQADYSIVLGASLPLSLKLGK